MVVCVTAHTESAESAKRAPPLKFLLVLVFNVASSSYKGKFVLRKSGRIQIYLKSVQKRPGTEIKVKIPESDHPVDPPHPSSFQLVLVFNAASSSYKGKFVLRKSGRIQIYLKSVQKRPGTEIKVKIPESDHPVDPPHPSSFQLVLVFNAASSSYKGKFVLRKSGRIQN